MCHSAFFPIVQSVAAVFGISKEKQKSINIELKNNNIMLIDKSININKDSRYITIEKENSFEDKLTKIFKELEKRYLK